MKSILQWYVCDAKEERIQISAVCMDTLEEITLVSPRVGRNGEIVEILLINEWNMDGRPTGLGK